MPVFNNILAGASGQTSEAAAGYQIDRSLRFNSGDAAHLQKVPSSTGNRKTWTWSCWFKRSRLSLEGFLLYSDVNGGNYRDAIRLESSNKLRLYLNGGVGASFLTDQVFRDPSSWYHLVIAVDTTQATASDRVKFYINGSQITSFSSATYPTQNYETGTFVSGKTARIGRDYSGNYFNGYLTDVHFIDGQALAASDFGEYDDNNVWQPKEFGGSFFTSVSTATGALPIHNTSGTFGGTKVTGNRTDPNASNLVLAISGSGSYQDISATIKGSGTNKTVTANGNVTTSSSEGKYYGGGSLDLTGSSGDYFSIPNSSDFAFGTGDFTVEFWIKTTDTAFNILDITAGGGWSTVLVNAGAQLFWQTNRATTNLFNISTNNDLIDGAWHHVAFVRSSNVVKPYLDGVQIGNSSGYTDNTDYDVTTGSLNIGSGANGVLDGYMQDIRIYKGVAKYTSNFTVAAPNSSFHLDFSDNTSTTTIAEDSSGNDNDWTANNISVASGAGNDSLIDTPSNYTAASGNNGGNYATLNPLDFASSGSPTLKNGNLDAEAGSGWQSIAATIGNLTSGKWYWEVKLGGGSGHRTGLSSVARSEASDTQLLGSGDICVNSSDGRVYVDGTEAGTGVGSLSGKTVGIALNLDANSVSFYQNGSLIHTVSSLSSTASWTPVHATRYSAVDNLNFGQRPFSYTPPTGHVSVCTQNLPDPTIADGSTAFDIATYTGNGTTNTAITGLNHSPDLLWIKSRSSTQWHFLADTVRGNTKNLASNATDAEETRTNRLLSFDSNGFTIGNNNTVNENNSSFVAWAWDGGDSNTSVSVGGLNSSFYNQSQTWSSNITTTGNNGTFHSSYPATNAFNNNDSNYAHGNGDGSQTAVVTLTLSPGVSCSNTVSFLGGMTGSGTATISVNGGTAVNLTSGSSATTKTDVSFSGTVTSIVITKTSSDNSGMLIYGFEIDGARLVDNGVSVTNVPSIASTERANSSAGFSIVTWTAAAPGTSTLSHGLSQAPAFVIAKSRSTANHWAIFHKDLGQSKLLRFISGAAISSSNYWGPSSSWNSSTFGVHSTTTADNNIGNMVAYCFAEVDGYSKFGSYTGNGSADGTFVFTGFRPRFLLYKRTDAADTVGWILVDSARNPINVVDDYLAPNSTAAEGTTNIVDFLSNGFKMRIAGADGNVSNGSYVYAAFAEHPFAANGGIAR